MSGFTPKHINERKLQAFSMGVMGKKAPTRQDEERRKKREEEERIGAIYKEFEEHFDDNPTAKISKTWVKAGTFNAGNRKEDSSGKGEIYKPKSKLAELAESFSSRQKAMELEAAKKAADLSRPEKPGKRKKEDKKKSNLEIFKDELKAIQVEREERQKYKAMIKAGGTPIPGRSLLDIPPGGALGDSLADIDGDPSSTNIYLGNISPRLAESELTKLFGKYGPLASVKVMYPRTDEEKSRGKNCGFVAFMSRADGERAMAGLLGKNIEGHDMRMGWGKPVGLPLQPVYIPPALLQFISPPPQSGLPFNCQPQGADKEKWGFQAISNLNSRPCEMPSDSRGKKRFNGMLKRSVIKVVIPMDRAKLSIINRMVEFVVREGPIFEATIMNRELNNPMFKFLFENQSPEHIYYRWRLFSILQGESKDAWSTKEFRMFKGGSVWKPPVPNVFTSGMPQELLGSDGASIDPEDREDSSKKKEPPKPPVVILPGKKPLTDDQRDDLEATLRSLMPDRNAVAEAMVWCIEASESVEEIVDCIAESLSLLETPVVKKIARLFLISDILHNCTVKGIPNVSFYRTGFQTRLPDIFSDLNKSYTHIEDRRTSEAFKQRVMSCFSAWEDWHLYPMDFLIKLQNLFLGLVSSKEEEEIKEESGAEGGSGSDEDVDGLPLDGAALLKGGIASARAKLTRSASHSDEESVDGDPIDGEGRVVSPAPPAPAGAFFKSKWETVDPEKVKEQAVTTSKWEREDNDELVKARKALMGAMASKWEDNDDDSMDGEPIERDDGSSALDLKAAEERRQILREIEVKVMGYQDELESGSKGIKAGWSISDQVEHYRKKLLRKALEDAPPPPPAAIKVTRKSLDAAVDSDSQSRSSRSSKKEKKKRKRERSSSAESSPKARSKKDEKKKKRRSRSYSSSPDRRKQRTPPKKSSKRSRSKSPKKSKKKRH